MLVQLLLISQVAVAMQYREYKYTEWNKNDLWNALKNIPDIQRKLSERSHLESTDDEKTVLFFDWDKTLAPAVESIGAPRCLKPKDGVHLSKEFCNFKEKYDCDIYILTNGSTWDIVAQSINEEHWNVDFLFETHKHELDKTMTQYDLRAFMEYDRSQLTSPQKLQAPITAFISSRTLGGEEKLYTPPSKFQIIKVLVEKLYRNNFKSIFFVDDQMDEHLKANRDLFGDEKQFILDNAIAVKEGDYPNSICPTVHTQRYYPHIRRLNKMIESVRDPSRSTLKNSVLTDAFGNILLGFFLVLFVYKLRTMY